jgi:hypothetical protein
MRGESHHLTGNKEAPPDRGKPILEADENSPEGTAKREQGHAAQTCIKRHKTGQAKPDHTDHQRRRPINDWWVNDWWVNGWWMGICLQGCCRHDDIDPLCKVTDGYGHAGHPVRALFRNQESAVPESLARKNWPGTVDVTISQRRLSGRI